MNLHHLASQSGGWSESCGLRTSARQCGATRQCVIVYHRGRSHVCCSGLKLYSSTSKMTYKRNITTVRLRNLKRSRRGTSSSQQPVNVTLEGLTSDTSGRTRCLINISSQLARFAQSCVKISSQSDNYEGHDRGKCKKKL